jgi:hypothetical protein
MIARPEQLAALTPAKRAQVIFAEAQSQLSTRLWRSAMASARTIATHRPSHPT